LSEERSKRSLGHGRFMRSWCGGSGLPREHEPLPFGRRSEGCSDPHQAGTEAWRPASVDRTEIEKRAHGLFQLCAVDDTRVASECLLVRPGPSGEPTCGDHDIEPMRTVRFVARGRGRKLRRPPGQGRTGPGTQRPSASATTSASAQPERVGGDPDRGSEASQRGRPSAVPLGRRRELLRNEGGPPRGRPAISRVDVHFWPPRPDRRPTTSACGLRPPGTKNKQTPPSEFSPGQGRRCRSPMPDRRPAASIWALTAPG
jgi:hypothetical protein